MAKRFSGRSFSLFAVWILAMFGFLVYLIGQSPGIGTVLLLLFYINLPIALFAILLGLAVVGEKQEEVREFFAIDAPRAGLAILIGATATFAVLLFVVALGRELRPIPLDVIFLQLIIIVPSEEFSFRFLLPRIMPGHSVGIPGWILAQLTFAFFHFQAFQLDPFNIAFAFVFGVFLYMIANADHERGGKRIRILGLGTAMGIHGVWNLFALSAGTGVTGGLVSLLGWL